MKKIICIALSLVMLLTLSACDMHNDVKPRNRLDTKWVCENPKIFFTVTKEDDVKTCVGALCYDKTHYKVSFSFDFGNDVNIIDYDAANSTEGFQQEHILARANCTFSEEKCEMKITESSIDGINVDDEITFNLVEELPEWATM